MNIGIAVDHGGFLLKDHISNVIREWGYRLKDFGAFSFKPGDDYPDYIIPMAKSLALGHIGRGIAICGSGVGACIAANKIPGVRAGLITDTYSAHQGVEDDNMNVICFGAGVVGFELACDLLHTFLEAKFSGNEPYLRRISKIRHAEDMR